MKILIISHNPLSTFNNMGKTLSSLFSSFKREELCQLYIHPSVPDTNACASYFRITDREALLSLCSRNTGSVIYPNTELHSPSDDSRSGRLYRRFKNKGTFIRGIRDLVWRRARWYTRELEEWIEKEAPTHIFAAVGMQKFIYDIIFSVSERFSLPVISYICDDYYFSRIGRKKACSERQNPLGKRIERLMSESSRAVFICESLKKLYEERFDIVGEVIMTGASVRRADGAVELPEISSFAYFGNIYLGREDSLCEIGRALDAINSERGTSYTLDVHSHVQDKKTIKALTFAHSISLHGFVGGDELDKKIESASVFLHAESFEKRNIEAVRHSISTKTADMLSIGKPFIVYAPKGIALTDYLTATSSAHVITDRDSLKRGIEALLDDESVRVKYIKNALKSAERNHDSEVNSKRLHTIFTETKEKRRDDRASDG